MQRPPLPGKTMATSLRFPAILLLILLTSTSSPADEPASTDVRFFETQIRPLLIQHCVECHGPDQQKGGLRLDQPAFIISGGDSGPAVIPNNVSDSPLIQAIRYEGLEMPPSGKLPATDIQVLVEWVQRGAPMPAQTAATQRPKSAEFSNDDRSWWAIQPLTERPVPAPANDSWSRNDIDRFILDAMLRQKLRPAPEADRLTLLRRLTFEVTGLPPNNKQIEDFLNDNRPDAWEQLVDQLLNSPAYGERWARHWLDLVRYADSDGYRADFYRPDAWRYRDYIIQSLNQDKPYDRFLQEQLAGDELFPDDPAALVATGFLRHWIYEYNNRDARGQWDLILTEVTDTTADVFLGLGLQCARCHDHKYDPLLQKDYFQLRAFFEAMLPDDQTVIASTAEQAAHAELQQQWESATSDIRQQIDQLLKPQRTAAHDRAVFMFPPDIQKLLIANPQSLTPLEQQLRHLAWRQVEYEYSGVDDRIRGEQKDQLLNLRRQLAAYDDQKPASLPTALAVRDIGSTAPPTAIPGKRTEVLPNIPAILRSANAPATLEITPPSHNPTIAHQSTGRRAALAQWLTNPDNPLTSRVIVNRIWQSRFGRGLAPNASDFGILGGTPTHPELLDYLALRLIRNNWKMKDIHRLILTSAAWKQSSDHPQFQAFQTIDPANQYHWRRDVRRLDAEQIRDAVLHVSGQLLPDAGGPGVLPEVPRRSIWLRVMRNTREPLLDVFDLPQFFSSSSSRQTTTTPVQSLLLWNSPIMQSHARRLADHVAAQSVAAKDADSNAQTALLNHLWLTTLGRPPAAAELDEAHKFLTQSIAAASAPDHNAVEQRQSPTRVPLGRLPARDSQALLVEQNQTEPRLFVNLPTPEPAPVLASNNNTPAPTQGFTIEVSFLLRSIANSGAVRTLAANWDGKATSNGWAFGVTGKGSRRKPQTLVIQLFGTNRHGKHSEAALFSDHHIDFNIPWYTAVSIQSATASASGTATFWLKNLSNDDEPVRAITVEHDIVTTLPANAPAKPELTVGFRPNSSDSVFDGLIDDLRLSNTSLSQPQLLLSGDTQSPHTIAHYRFEATPGLLHDSSTKALHLQHQPSPQNQQLSPQHSALTDLAHILLNSSEFLYTR